MGEYYILVNFSKKEFVDAFDQGGGKLGEWCVNKGAAHLMPFLMAKYGASVVQHTIKMDRKEVTVEKERWYAGSWAGDTVMLVKDYDEEVYQTVRKQFTDITDAVVQEFNLYLDEDEEQEDEAEFIRRTFEGFAQITQRLDHIEHLLRKKELEEKTCTAE